VYRKQLSVVTGCPPLKWVVTDPAEPAARRLKNPMRILIDGYNLIRRVPDLKRLERTDMEKARDALVRELSVYRMGKKHRICVVFDGAEAIHLGSGAEKVRGISVRFSPRGSSADQVILEAMRNNEVDVLVSADRELTGDSKERKTRRRDAGHRARRRGNCRSLRGRTGRGWRSCNNQCRVQSAGCRETGGVQDPAPRGKNC
jgi:hypothetical protein